MKTGPLNESEVEWLDDILSKYAVEGTIMDVAELDGLLTAILSGPTEIEPAQWLLAIWGGADNVPRWANDRERDRFVNLTLQQMSDIAERLSDYPEQFEPMFGSREEEGQELTIVEEWCFGYMRGVGLSDWSALPAELQAELDVIALHGTEERFEGLMNYPRKSLSPALSEFVLPPWRFITTGLSTRNRRKFSSPSGMRRRWGATILARAAAVRNISSAV